LQAVDWQIIVKRHGPIVWQTAYRLLGNYADTADCFQETFVCALEVSRRQHVRNFPALLSRLATTRAIDQLRQRLRRSHADTKPADRPAPSTLRPRSGPASLRADVPSHNPDPAQQLETEELAARLRKAIAQLPQQHAEVFCLRYLNGMSYRLIAKQLGIKTSAAGVSLHRARARLRMLLESAFAAEADFGGVGKTQRQEESEDSYDTGKEPAG